MYVCLCSAVTERQIHEAVFAGAQTLEDLRENLGVAAACGRCTSCAKQCLREVHASLQPDLQLAAA